MDLHPSVRTGFALRKLTAVLALVVIALALATVTGERTRRNAQLGQDILKLHEIGAATAVFAHDNAEGIWSLSWQGGTSYNTPWPELNFASTDMQAQANQVVAIVRSRGHVNVTATVNLAANFRWSHLALAEYLQSPLPWLTFISSADEDLLRWASAPNCTSCFAPCQAHQPVNPFRGSFELVLPHGTAAPQGPASTRRPTTPSTFPAATICAAVV